jgi:hypothetical protein
MMQKIFKSLRLCEVLKGKLHVTLNKRVEKTRYAQQNATNRNKTNSLAFSPPSEQRAADCRRSLCQLMRVEGCCMVSATGPHGR